MKRVPPVVLGLGLVLAFGCSGDDAADDPDAGQVVQPDRDAGPERDAGDRDGGTLSLCGDDICDPDESISSCPQDCFVEECENPTEGCACHSSFSNGDDTFLQDDCVDADMLCIPWDELSGRDAELTSPLQSCVRSCVTDADCGMTDGGDPRVCTDSVEYDGASASIGRICVDRLAVPDAYCGPSKNASTHLPGVPLRTAREMVGCAGSTACAFGVLPSIHPDEGVCLQLCGLPGDPPCAAEQPFCNPNLFSVTSTDGTQFPQGICSVARLGVGSWCRPELPDRAGLTELCDTSSDVMGDLGCVRVGVTYGVCLELCNTSVPPGTPCQSADPANGPLYCVNELLQGGGGICMTPDCSAFPDTCGGDGALGHGRMCLTVTQDADGVCVDRRGPPLVPGALDGAGTLTSAGGDCIETPMAFSTCPEATSCFMTQNGGTCLAGCSRAAGASPTYCEDTLDALGINTTTSTCAEISALMDPAIGLCAGD